MTVSFGSLLRIYEAMMHANHTVLSLIALWQDQLCKMLSLRHKHRYVHTHKQDFQGIFMCVHLFAQARPMEHCVWSRHMYVHAILISARVAHVLQYASFTSQTYGIYGARSWLASIHTQKHKHILPTYYLSCLHIIIVIVDILDKFQAYHAQTAGWKALPRTM
jgi:hypothetical protein